MTCWSKLMTLAAIALVVALGAPQKAMASSAAVSAAAAGGGCCTPTEICKDPRCISYKSHRFLRCKWDPCHTQKTVLQVPDYCCCCLVEVPVCIPACCSGAPTVCSHCGHFGHDVVEYSWCCGYHLKVVFDKCGNVVVHSYGL
ncbi:MAG TPA: hypothetical protein VFV87_18045 [Pirellulaceae bacterium]|nr:hypothetical protein [Pirellulaceae bacterium]